jgi:ribulose-phosphate 3-epimerase
MIEVGMKDFSRIKIAPSILSADFARLGQQVEEAEQAGADYIHFDVMDGMFVPNISVGPLVLEALKPVTKLPMDVHLMIEGPDRYLEEFARAGAAVIMVHQENVPHLHRTVQHISSLGCRAGVVLNPATPLITLEEILPYLSRVLIMSVNPGFGGQEYIESSTSKIRRLREMANLLNPQLEIEVDGGIKASNIREVAEAGADVIVAGSAVFNKTETVAQAMAKLREALR